MYKFFFKKAHRVESLIFEYLETIGKCQANFSNAMSACLLYGTRGEDFGFYLKETHKYESRADDIYQEINELMYGKALIPESRGDILGLLGSIERIPNRFERILYMIQTQRITVPRSIWTDIQELVKISLECCDLLIRQVNTLFQKKEDLRELMGQIDAKESHCDFIERRVITKAFEDNSIEPFDKLQLRELVESLGDISDLTDQVSRRINIISLKRRV